MKCVRDDSYPGYGVEIELLREHCRLKTPYQEVLIADTRAFGKALFMDENLQSAAFDEGAYHAALVHPAMFSHARPRQVLIGGGGEGATLREVLRHPSVERVTMVDIDEAAVRACQTHLPEWHAGAFQDPRVQLIFEDVRKVLEREEHRFDVAILDLGDPVSSESSQYSATKQFYELVSRALGEGGVLSMQAGAYEGFALHNFSSFITTLEQTFRTVHPYRAAIQSFGGEWGFALAADWELPAVPPSLGSRAERAGAQAWLDYDPAWHRALFSLSPRERSRLRRRGRVLTDDAPVEVTGGSD